MPRYPVVLISGRVCFALQVQEAWDNYKTAQEKAAAQESELQVNSYLFLYFLASTGNCCLATQLITLGGVVLLVWTSAAVFIPSGNFLIHSHFHVICITGRDPPDPEGEAGGQAAGRGAAGQDERGGG